MGTTKMKGAATALVLLLCFCATPALARFRRCRSAQFHPFYSFNGTARIYTTLPAGTPTPPEFEPFAPSIGSFEVVQEDGEYFTLSTTINGFPPNPKWTACVKTPTANGATCSGVDADGPGPVANAYFTVSRKNRCMVEKFVIQTLGLTDPMGPPIQVINTVTATSCPGDVAC